MAMFEPIYGNFVEIISLEAPGNYSASIWIHIFSICVRETLKTLISMISGFLNPAPKIQENTWLIRKNSML